MTFQDFSQRYHLQLDCQQQAAVQAVDGPVLLLAVPGSGKTTTLVARLGYLVYGCHVPARSILTTTYTVAATNELRSRFAALFGPADANLLEFRTINGVCARIIHAYEQQGHRAFELVTEEGRLTALLAEIWREVQQDFPTEADLRTVRTQITCIKNQMLKEDELAALETDSRSKVRIVPIYRAYCKAMRQRKWMDYDDQMVYALAILRRNPGILAQLQRQYRYFCVDEAQDTSRIQHAILRLLAGNSRNLFMVGDEDQSIYGFRAACPQALLEFESLWPGAKVLMMEQNYRSSPQIVQAADGFIRQNRARHNKKMTTSNPDGPSVSSLPCTDRSEQYRKLAELAQEANRTGRQTAVLYRDNDSALPIIDLLARQGIPYQARSVDGLFFQSRLVRDIHDIFRLAQHPNDGQAFLRIYYKLGAGISRPQAEAAVQSGAALLAALRCMELGGRARSRVQDLQTHFQLLLQDDAAQGITRIIEHMGYGAYLEENRIDHGRLDILRTLAEREASLAGLFQRLEHLQHLIREGSAANSCFWLSTIHSAKGLEYDHVILADVVDGVLPQDPILGQLPTDEQLTALEEERRIFYVGMTRAKRELTLVTFPIWRHPSAFARVLFPPPPMQEKTSNGAHSYPAAGITIAAAPKKAAARMEALAKEYFVGARVVHRSYGKGQVVRREEDTIFIQFDEGKERTFLLTAALSAGDLKLEPI